jgi:tetratricopeptide (TPR) repeat protein
LSQKGLSALLEKESLDDKPWARFRIQTNLGAIALDLGLEEEAAAHFSAAYAARPEHPTAIANLSLGRMIEGRFAEAMDLARKALDAVPRADSAIGWLMQAAARADWEGNPEDLIPTGLRGSAYADLGLAEFLRLREIPGWAERSIKLSRQHPKVPEFKRISAIAVLALVTDSGSPTAQTLVTTEDLNRAADDMKALAERCLDLGIEAHGDLVAYLNNAAMLLRLCGRQGECEALLRRGLPSAPGEPQLRRMLALAQTAQGHRGEAIATLAADEDCENRLLAAELSSADDPTQALEQVLAIDAASLNPRLARLRWRLAGDLALKIGSQETLQQAVAGLRALEPRDVAADLLAIRWDQKAGLDQGLVHARLRGVVTNLPADADMITRYLLAEELRDQGLPEEACSLLQGLVDLTSATPATKLYLTSLAAARRDETFRQTLSTVAPVVRNDPDMLWTAAAHAWNVGDLPRAYDSIEILLEKEPDNARARLLKIEILVRQNRPAEILSELDKPVENLRFVRPQGHFRIARLLGHFGYYERAAALAYRLFLENRDSSEAWMALMALVLDEGRGQTESPRRWEVCAVAPDVAINLQYDDEEELFVVVESDVQSPTPG